MKNLTVVRGNFVTSDDPEFNKNWGWVTLSELERVTGWSRANLLSIFAPLSKDLSLKPEVLVIRGTVKIGSASLTCELVPAGWALQVNYALSSGVTHMQVLTTEAGIKPGAYTWNTMAAPGGGYEALAYNAQNELVPFFKS